MSKRPASFFIPLKFKEENKTMSRMDTEIEVQIYGYFFFFLTKIFKEGSFNMMTNKYYGTVKIN